MQTLAVWIGQLPLTKVINDAVSSEVGYATGNWNGIYDVAQCWRDLNMDQCRQCLNTWYKSFTHCPQGFIQGDDYNKSCVIHFATYKFYGDDVLLASPSKRATEGIAHYLLENILKAFANSI